MDQLTKEERDQAERERREELAAQEQEDLYRTTHVQFPDLDDKARNVQNNYNKQADRNLEPKLVIPKHKRKKTPNYMKPNAAARNKLKKDQGGDKEVVAVDEITDKRRATIANKTSPNDLKNLTAMLKTTLKGADIYHSTTKQS